MSRPKASPRRLATWPSRSNKTKKQHHQWAKRKQSRPARTKRSSNYNRLKICIKKSISRPKWSRGRWKPLLKRVKTLTNKTILTKTDLINPKKNERVMNFPRCHMTPQKWIKPGKTSSSLEKIKARAAVKVSSLWASWHPTIWSLGQFWRTALAWSMIGLAPSTKNWTSSGHMRRRQSVNCWGSSHPRRITLAKRQKHLIFWPRMTNQSSSMTLTRLSRRRRRLRKLKTTKPVKPGHCGFLVFQCSVRSNRDGTTRRSRATAQPFGHPCSAQAPLWSLCKTLIMT